MIPCLGVLILNRGDLLLRLFQSIDYPIHKLCIVQNGNDDTVDQAIEEIRSSKGPWINKVYLERPFRNMGVAPAWNSIIKSFPECEYWLIANNDTVFLPGDLKKYHTTWQNNQHSLIAAANGAFNCFIISPYIVQQVGLFDENIWPIYHEDVDYFIRMQKAGISRIPLQTDVGFSNDGSWTMRSNATYHQKNQITQHSNGEYVDAKWGQDTSYSLPWNNNLAHISNWQYDPYRRQQHSAIWNNFENTANRIDKDE
jgi:GT2 family glycosyltransferase